VQHLALSEEASGLTVLAIDRPPANAMNLELLRELVDAIEGFSGDPPRALVLAGRPGCFSAGVDLKAIPGYGPAQQREMVSLINAMALGVYRLPCPVVGAITGHAIAGGFVLALCSDLRVASTEGRYGLTEVKVGVDYPQAAIGIVAAELAPHAARALALGSELAGAEACLRLGAFDEVLAPDDVLPRALTLANGLLAFAPEAYSRTKSALRGATAARLHAAASADPLLEHWID
jgi:enoyl-CoA hydratase